RHSVAWQSLRFYDDGAGRVTVHCTVSRRGARARADLGRPRLEGVLPGLARPPRRGLLIRVAAEKGCSSERVGFGVAGGVHDFAEAGHCGRELAAFAVWVGVE